MTSVETRDFRSAGIGAGDFDEEFAAAILDGLSRPQKSLPSRYFYDERGSELFEDITRLPEYYPARTETAILSAHAAEMSSGVAEDCVLVEFGSGSSRKTEILLEALPRLRAYVPIDVSDSALEDASQRLKRQFPLLAVRPISGDFSRPIRMFADLAGCTMLGFFPGSTIGNLERPEAKALLEAFGADLSPEGRLIIGVDLVKDEETLLLAYNDPSGVTAAFNLNLLARINREFGEAFDLDGFRHEAIYNRGKSRIEMHLVSKRDQSVNVLGRHFQFRSGETIHTENSHKYTIPSFQELARSSGWLPREVWTDDKDLFSVHELILPGNYQSSA